MKARRREVNYPLALWRRRWLILPFVLIGLIVALVLFSRMIRLYRTGATVILVSQSISDQVYARGWRPPPANRLKLIQLEVTSNAFLEKVAKAMKQETPESEPLKLQQLGRLVSVVEIDPETWIFQCVSPDPRKAAQRANVFARTFVEHSRSKKVQVTEGSADLLKDEVGRLEQDLREEKERLARYQAEHRGELPSDREALRAEQTFLRTRLVELDGRIDAR